jgi:signal transduction histidine kinase
MLGWAAALMPSRASTPVTDSLQRRLEDKSLTDSQRVDIMLQLAWEYRYLDGTRARDILYQCIAVGARTRHYAWVGDAYAYMGSSFLATDDYDSAFHYYQKAETYYRLDTSEQAQVNIAANRMSMGTAALQKGEHQTALTHYLDAIGPLERAGDYGNLATAYANIGLVYNDLKQYDKALDYHEKALQQCRKDSSRAVRSKAAQIQMFLVLDNLNLKRFQEAHQALRASDSLVRALDSDYLRTIFYGMQGRYYQELRDYPASNEAFSRALDYARKSDQKFQQGSMMQHLGINMFSLERYPQSVRYLQDAYAIFIKIGDKVRERAVLRYLPRAYTALKDDRNAVRYYERYVHLNDSLNDLESRSRINEIENRYQAARKQDSILVLQKNFQLQQLAARRTRTLSNAVIIGVLLLAVIAFLLYRNLQGKHRLVSQQAELRARRIAELEKSQQLVAVQSVLKGQEQERSRLARDLHDGIGGMLSGIKLSLATLHGTVSSPEGDAAALSGVIDQLDRSITELRRVSHNMMPEALIHFGLKEALENYLESLNRSGDIRFQFQAFGDDARMEQTTEIILYRIVQELLSNIIRHAHASTALLQFIHEKGHYSVTVEDDGVGFDQQSARKDGGAGLSNIAARVSYLGATIDIRSSPGEGTSVTVEGDEAGS